MPLLVFKYSISIINDKDNTSTKEALSFFIFSPEQGPTSLLLIFKFN